MKTHEFYQDKLANQDSEFKKVGWDNEQKAIERYQFANKLIAKNQCKSILEGPSITELTSSLSTSLMLTLSKDR
jgi:hypothetical protein